MPPQIILYKFLEPVPNIVLVFRVTGNLPLTNSRTDFRNHVLHVCKHITTKWSDT